MAVKYATRCRVHDTRQGARKTLGANRLFVGHTSEGGETTGSAEALCSFIERPRVTNPDGSVNLASYHYLIDTDQVIPAVEEDRVAYSAAGANHDGVHFCFPGKANQTREQWLDDNSRAMIWQAAELIVDRCPALLIPIRRLTVAEVVAGWTGICDHYDISRAYKKTNHTDVGPGFPWDVLFADIRTIMAPAGEEEEEVKPIHYIVPSGPWAKFWYPWLLITSDYEAHVTVGSEIPAGLLRVECTDEGQYRRRCHQAGIQLDTETPGRADSADER